MLGGADVDVALINIPPGDFLDGGEGLAAVPGRQRQFADALDTTVNYATALGVDCVNVFPGCCLNADNEGTYLATFKTNLLAAADRFAEHDIACLFEAVNRTDAPGFLVHSHTQQLEVIEELQHPNLFAQVDIYHVARDAGPDQILESLARILPVTRHIQFADHLGRGEPGSGGIEFESILSVIRESKFCGTVRGRIQADEGHTDDTRLVAHVSTFVGER